MTRKKSPAVWSAKHMCVIVAEDTLWCMCMKTHTQTHLFCIHGYRAISLTLHLEDDLFLTRVGRQLWVLICMQTPSGRTNTLSSKLLMNVKWIVRPVWPEKTNIIWRTKSTLHSVNCVWCSFWVKHHQTSWPFAYFSSSPLSFSVYLSNLPFHCHWPILFFCIRFYPPSLPSSIKRARRISYRYKYL